MQAPSSATQLRVGLTISKNDYILPFHFTWVFVLDFSTLFEELSNGMLTTLYQLQVTVSELKPLSAVITHVYFTSKFGHNYAE